MLFLIKGTVIVHQLDRDFKVIASKHKDQFNLVEASSHEEACYKYVKYYQEKTAENSFRRWDAVVDESHDSTVIDYKGIN